MAIGFLRPPDMRPHDLEAQRSKDLGPLDWSPAATRFGMPATHAYISGRSVTLEISFQRPEAFIVDSNVAALMAGDSGVAAIMAEPSDSDLTMNTGNFTTYIHTGL